MLLLAPFAAAVIAAGISVARLRASRASPRSVT